MQLLYRTALFLVVSAPCVAFASGFQLDLHDTKGTGRGFAYTAGVRDAAAGYYNPASIAAIGSSNISLSLHYLTATVDYKPDPGSGGVANSTERLSAVVPALHAIFDASENVDFGVSIFNPFALSTKWERDWSGRYLALENSVNFLFISPAISIKTPLDGLYLGVGPQFVLTLAPPGQDAGLRLNRAIDQRFVGSGDGELLVEGDTSAMNVGYFVALTYIVPIWDNRIRFGFVYRSTPMKHKLKGEAEFIGAQGLGLPIKTDVKTDITLPSWFQTGVEVEVIKDRLWVEFNYKWTDWRPLDKVSLDFRDPAAPDTDLEFKWGVVNMFIFGIEGQVFDGFRLRAGFFYDENPVPADTLRPELPDADRYGMSFGMSYATGRVEIGLSYMKLFFDTATKRNGEGAALPGGPATANGEYNNNVDIISASLSVSF